MFGRAGTIPLLFDTDGVYWARPALIGDWWYLTPGRIVRGWGVGGVWFLLSEPVQYCAFGIGQRLGVER